MNLLSLCYSGVEKPTYGLWELAVPLDVENPTYTFLGICAMSVPNGVELLRYTTNVVNQGQTVSIADNSLSD